MRLRFAVLTSFALILAGCGGKAPESAVEHFYRSVEKGEITEAKGFLSKQILGMLGDNKATTALVSETEKIKNCGGIDTVKVNLTGEGETRSGTTVVTYKKSDLPKCKTLNQKTVLIKEDGNWKLSASK
jgi:hypothetical protein